MNYIFILHVFFKQNNIFSHFYQTMSPIQNYLVVIVLISYLRGTTYKI
jgi:hypothetical protein